MRQQINNIAINDDVALHMDGTGDDRRSRLRKSIDIRNCSNVAGYSKKSLPSMKRKANRDAPRSPAKRPRRERSIHYFYKGKLSNVVLVNRKHSLNSSSSE